MGAAAREPSRSSTRKSREAEAEAWADEVAAGRLEPFVVGEPEEDLDGDGDGEDADRRWHRGGTLGRRDRGGGRHVTGRDRVRRPSERRQVEPVNALLGEDRAIVSDVPGTTRDAIDTRLAWGRSEVVLIDTAGIRRRGKVASGAAAERYSTMRALTALSRADVAVLVIDAVEGLTSQDAHVAGYAVEEGKGLVVAVNKWDLVADKTDRTFDQYIEWIRNEAPFLEFAPVVSISAKTGQRVGRVLELAVDIWAERRRRVPTAELNRVLMAATDRTPPPLVRGKRAEALLRDPGRDRPADVRVLRIRRIGRPLLVSSLPREPVARDVRVRRHADPAGVPRPCFGEAAASPEDAVISGHARAAGRPPREVADRADGRRAPGRGRRSGGVGHDARSGIIAGREPVLLVSHRPEVADEINATHRNERRLPGVDLPAALTATADPSRARRGARPRDLRRPLVAPAVGGRGIRAVRRPRMPTCCRS